MNDMHNLLSNALPAPEDEPHLRDVVDAALEWGERRRRRDWTLAGAAALAVIAVGAGAAVVGGGSGSPVSAGGSPTVTDNRSPGRIPPFPNGTSGTENCPAPGSTGSSDEFCRLFLEQQRFDIDFAKASVPYIQAALPAGFHVTATGSHMVLLTGPNGKTNYLFPSVTAASTLDGHTPSCGSLPGCVQTSTIGGVVVVQGGPSDAESAGFVKDGLKDPRITINVGTSGGGSINGVPAPTSATPLLTNQQLAAVVGNPAFVGFAKEKYAHLQDIVRQLQKLSPPSASDSGGWTPTGSPPTKPTFSGTSPTSGQATVTDSLPTNWSSTPITMSPTGGFSSVPGTPLGSATSGGGS